MFDALGAFCGTDCSAGCDTGSIRNRRPTEFGEESEEELSYALFECADNDGDVADAHAALARPFREPPSPGSAPRRCEACGMSFSAAAFEAHAAHCAKAPSPSRDDVLILRAARRARVDELYDAYDDSSGDDGAGAAAPPRDARFPEDPFAAAPRTPSRTPSQTPSPPRTLDEWFDKPPSASPAERPFVAVGDRAAGDVRARLLARFPEDVFDDEPSRVPAVSPDGGRAAPEPFAAPSPPDDDDVPDVPVFKVSLDAPLDDGAAAPPADGALVDASRGEARDAALLEDAILSWAAAGDDRGAARPPRRRAAAAADAARGDDATEAPTERAPAAPERPGASRAAAPSEAAPGASSPSAGETGAPSSPAKGKAPPGPPPPVGARAREATADLVEEAPLQDARAPPPPAKRDSPLAKLKSAMRERTPAESSSGAGDASPSPSPRIPSRSRDSDASSVDIDAIDDEAEPPDDTRRRSATASSGVVGATAPSERATGVERAPPRRGDARRRRSSKRRRRGAGGADASSSSDDDDETDEGFGSGDAATAALRERRFFRADSRLRAMAPDDDDDLGEEERRLVLSSADLRADCLLVDSGSARGAGSPAGEAIEVIAGAVLAKKAFQDAERAMRAATERQRRLVERLHAASHALAAASRDVDRRRVGRAPLEDALFGPDTPRRDRDRHAARKRESQRLVEAESARIASAAARLAKARVALNSAVAAIPDDMRSDVTQHLRRYSEENGAAPPSNITV